MALMLLVSGCRANASCHEHPISGGQRYQLQANGNIFVNKDTFEQQYR